MTETPEVTSKILNELILTLGYLSKGKDELFSLQEFAMGVPLQYRSIDLCYGYAKIPPSTSELAQFEAVIGRGLTRITNQNVSGKLTKVNLNFTGLNFTTLLPSDKKYQNVYAFANIFLSQSPGSDDATAILSTSILKGESAGSPIFITKELDLETVINMSRQDEIPDAQGPNLPYVKIFNVIIEINYFDPNDLSTKDVIFHFVDKRKPRGWGGFAEEFMGVYLTPHLINKNNDFNEVIKICDESFYNLINSWISLRFWSPSFLDFWTDPDNADLMPDSLKDYLELKFSILI